MTPTHTVVSLLVIDPEHPENLRINLDALRDALMSAEAAGQFGDGFDVDGLLNEIGRTTEAFLGERGGVGASGFDLSSVGELGSALADTLAEFGVPTTGGGLPDGGFGGDLGHYMTGGAGATALGKGVDAVGGSSPGGDSLTKIGVGVTLMETGLEISQLGIGIMVAAAPTGGGAVAGGVITVVGLALTGIGGAVAADGAGIADTMGDDPKPKDAGAGEDANDGSEEDASESDDDGETEGGQSNDDGTTTGGQSKAPEEEEPSETDGGQSNDDGTTTGGQSKMTEMEESSMPTDPNMEAGRTREEIAEHLAQNPDYGNSTGIGTMMPGEGQGGVLTVDLLAALLKAEAGSSTGSGTMMPGLYGEGLMSPEDLAKFFSENPDYGSSTGAGTMMPLEGEELPGTIFGEDTDEPLGPVPGGENYSAAGNGGMQHHNGLFADDMGF